MLIYEVTIDLPKEIEQAYQAWLTLHIEKMLLIDGFMLSRLLKETAFDTGFAGCRDSRTIFIVQYEVSSKDALTHYLTHHAASMRADGSAFQEDCFISRRVFELKSSWISPQDLPV